MKHKDRLKQKNVSMRMKRNEVHIFELHQQKCVAGRQDKKI